LIIDARLEGGPFDGAAEPVLTHVGPPPGVVGAWTCPECGEIHIDPEAPPDAERYRYDHKDGPTAVYIYGDLNLSPSDDREKELIGV
jgi:hypothetical protein